MNTVMRHFINIITETQRDYGLKVSKEKAKYTDQSPYIDQCMACRHFIKPHSCEIVDGTIDPDGWCKYFHE
jgi:hypothetical protein